jgi:hypothetical protein
MMERIHGEDPRQETISASELGRYTYCARAWWLERVCGLVPRNIAALQLGTRRHEAHGQVVARAQREASLARWLLGLAILLGAALICSLWLR